MIGNDIVDRGQAKQESNWKRKGYLDKLFTSSEQQLIRTASDPDCMVWILWSMKESVYKANNRETERRLFNPIRICCTITSLTAHTAEATVWYGRDYQATTQITPDYVASLAYLPDNPPVENQKVILFSSSDYGYQSTTLRTDITRQYAGNLTIPPEFIHVSKNRNGVPILILRNDHQQVLTLPISISHHGYYGAYCIGHNSPFFF